MTAALLNFLSRLSRFAGRHPGTFCAGVAAALVLAMFGRSLGGYFTGDDFAYVARFEKMAWREWPMLFAREWSGGIWGYALPELRPVTALTLMLDARWWGVDPFGFRLTNLILHAACAALVGRIAWRAAGRAAGPAIFATACFAVHPVHAEPILWITGRVDIVPTLFYLAAFAAWLTWRDGGGGGWLPVMWLAYGAAAFAKEFGLTLPLMVLAADLVWRPDARRSDRPAWLPYVGWLAMAALYFAARRAALGEGVAPQALPTVGDGGLMDQILSRQRAYLDQLFPLSAIWLQGTLARVLIILGALGLGWAVIRVWRREAIESAERRRTLLFSALAWHVVATLPLVVTYVSPRHLYLASAGSCIALALLAAVIFPRRAALATVGLLTTAMFAWLLIEPVHRWSRAAEISGRIASEVHALRTSLPEGAGLLLDVPAHSEGGYVWAWAAPFALQSPFAVEDLAERWVVVTTPEAFRDPEKWSHQPELVQLRVVPEAAVVQVDAAGVVRTWRVPGAQVRRAAEEFPFGAGGSTEWRNLIKSLSPR